MFLLQDALTGQDTGAKNLTSIVFTLLSLPTVKKPVVAVQVSVFCSAERTRNVSIRSKEIVTHNFIYVLNPT